MSREIKRVALDFEWPLNKVWKGYINPHYKRCPAKDCCGGETAASAWVLGVARLIAMLGEQAASAPHAEELRRRGQTFPHPYLEELPFAPRDRAPPELLNLLARAGDDDALARQIARKYWRDHEAPLRPLTDGLVEFVGGLAGTPPVAGPLNGNIEFEIYKKLLSVAGITNESWETCAVCGGDGMDASVRAAHDAWKKEEPPAGTGWQLWETVSEGSPLSPVFVHRESLVEHLVNQGYSKKAAEAFTKVGWAPSGVIVDGREVYEDIESCGIDS
jgi:hypothetical protein